MSIDQITERVEMQSKHIVETTAKITSEYLKSYEDDFKKKIKDTEIGNDIGSKAGRDRHIHDWQIKLRVTLNIIILNERLI